jgi:hypothetical protein
MKPLDIKLYELVKEYINSKYKKPSAYRSMAYMKEYKRRGGKFAPDNKPRNLLRWMKEEWKDVNPRKTKKTYPVFRPTKRISGKTPVTINEISRNELLKQSTRKQKLKGNRNLPPWQML